MTDPGRGTAAANDGRAFRVGLLSITLAALALRLVYTLVLQGTLGTLHGVAADAVFYRGTAAELAAGHGYVNPFSIIDGQPEPTATHPPLFSLYLAAWTKLGVVSVEGHRVACDFLGTAGVALIGLVGRHVGGPRVGLIAAGIAAVYPPLVFNDGGVISESLYAPLIALSLVCAYRLHARPGAAPAVALGLVIGLATLTR
jgi:hypothetical protein